MAPPATLYSSPETVFVAGFIGSPRMNFVAATVAGVDDAGVEVVDAAGRRYRAGVAGGALEPGAEVTLGLRPEHLDVSEAEGHPVVVENIEQLGGDSYLYCRTEDGLTLTMHFAGQTAIRRGETTYARFRPEFAHLFRDSDGLALERLRIGESVSR